MKEANVKMSTFIPKIPNKVQDKIANNDILVQLNNRYLIFNQNGIFLQTVNFEKFKVIQKEKNEKMGLRSMSSNIKYFIFEDSE